MEKQTAQEIARQYQKAGWLVDVKWKAGRRIVVARKFHRPRRPRVRKEVEA